MYNWDINISHYEFMASTWLWSLLLLPFLFYYLLKKERSRSGDWKYTGISSDQIDLKNNSISWIRILLIFAKTSLLACFLIALAKPYSWEANENKNEASKYGIDIILAMDVSMSMLAKDFNPNRLTVAKEVAKEFIDGRHGDRIGLVVYAGEAYTACPATLDYALLKGQIDKIDGSNLEPGTAIGTGLGTAVVQLRSDSLKSKVIILLTDGSNNWGEISPLEAAELALMKNICVYTIGIGSNGSAPTPVITPMGMRYENLPVEIDEATLGSIAEKTNGKYFRATDKSGLRAIYNEIELLEKRKMKDKQFTSEPPATPEAFLHWALLLLTCILLIELVLFIPTHD